MKEYLDMTQMRMSFTDANVNNTETFRGRNAVKITSSEPASIRFDSVDGKIAGVEFTEDKILVIPVYFDEKHSIYFKLNFYEDIENHPKKLVDAAMGVMPGIEVDIVYALKNLNLKDLFIPRTPGRLKNTSTGTPSSADKINTFVFRIPKSAEKYTVTIGNPYVTDEMPKIEIPKTPLVDKMGQWIKKDWASKTRSEDEMIANYRKYLSEELPPMSEGRSQYGGSLDKKFEATGFFHTVKDDARSYIADPEGYGFFSIGVDCVRPSISGVVNGIEGLFEELPSKDGEYADAWQKSRLAWGSGEFDFLRRNLIRAFGENWYDAWSKITAKRLKAWGFNTVANWSDIRFAKANNIPYVTETPFPTTQIGIFRDFPDVYSDEYRESARKCAQYLESFKEDKYLIGYFLRNEPHFAFGKYNLASFMLESSENSACKSEFIKFMRLKYKDISALNCAWGTDSSSFESISNPISNESAAFKADTEAFTKKMIHQYVRVPSEECRAIAPNHMNLGLRWAWIASDDFYEGAEFFDIFSINCYSIVPSAEQIAEIGRKSGKPVIIGEFHAGALDVGLPANSLQGVKNQKERGYFYSYYIENAAVIPELVGAHYFQCNDQPVLGRFDGENLNIGLADVCGVPYADMIENIIDTNKKIYKVRNSEIPPTDRPPITAPREGF